MCTDQAHVIHVGPRPVAVVRDVAARYDVIQDNKPPPDVGVVARVVHPDHEAPSEGLHVMFAMPSRGGALILQARMENDAAVPSVQLEDVSPEEALHVDVDEGLMLLPVIPDAQLHCSDCWFFPGLAVGQEQKCYGSAPVLSSSVVGSFD